MRRTIYLNFDLSKAEERACYKFLADSDRAKKKIVCMLLINRGLVNPKIIITDDELPKLKKKQELVQKRGNQSVKDETYDDVIDNSAETMMHSELNKEVSMASSVITPTFPDGTPVKETEENNPYSMFTEAQMLSMRQKGIDYEILKPIQLKVLASRLNEGYPYKAAIMEAQFTQ